MTYSAESCRIARATLCTCCALFIGDNRERLIFYDFFFRSVRIAPYGANGGERVKATKVSKR